MIFNYFFTLKLYWIELVIKTLTTDIPIIDILASRFAIEWFISEEGNGL